MGSDGAEQALARFGRRDASRRAREEPQAEPFLEATDGVAQRRRRDLEPGGRLGKAPLATAMKAIRSLTFGRGIERCRLAACMGVVRPSTGSG
jgi:hypothetical protein